jgi:hypothetical protein
MDIERPANNAIALKTSLLPEYSLLFINPKAIGTTSRDDSIRERTSFGTINGSCGVQGEYKSGIAETAARIRR